MLSDPDFLAVAPPEHVMGLEPSGPRERLAAAVYRGSIHLHRTAAPTVRRQILALAAAGYGAGDLAARMAGDGPWTVRWSTGSYLDHRIGNRLAPFAGAVWTVTTVVLDGRTCVVTGDNHGGVRVWDLITGAPAGPSMIADPTASDPVLALGTAKVGDHPWVVAGGHAPLWAWNLATADGRPLSGHTDIVTSVATATVNGSPVAVTAGYDTVRVWDLVTAEQVGRLPVDSRVLAVAAAVVDGRPCAVTGGWDGAVRLWDLATGTPAGEPMTGHGEPVEAVATIAVDGRPCAVTAGRDGAVKLWDLTTGAPAGEPMTGHPHWVAAAATVPVDGRPCAVTAGHRDRYVRVWDLAARRPRESLRIAGTAADVATAVVGGRPYAVVGTETDGVWILDLTMDEPVGTPLAGHIFDVKGTAVGAVDGRSCAVTVGADGVRVWDLATGRQVGEPLAGPDHRIRAVATTTVGGAPHAVTGGQDGTVRLWNLATGQQVGEPLLDGSRARNLSPPGIGTVATTTIDGVPHVLAGGTRVLDLWNLTTLQPAGEPLTGPDEFVWTVATATVDGVPHAVTGHGDGTVRLWNLVTSRPVGEALTGHDDMVRTVATTTVDGVPHAVTGGVDGTVRVWDLVRREQVGRALVCPGRVNALSVGPDGCLVVGFGSEVAVFAPASAVTRDDGNGGAPCG